MSRIQMLLFGLLATTLVACNCENRVDGEEIDQCVDVGVGMDDFDARDACDACCLNESYDIGQVHTAQGDEPVCSCGYIGMCEE